MIRKQHKHQEHVVLSNNRLYLHTIRPGFSMIVKITP